jgi:class 3 adenylate cyclase
MGSQREQLEAAIAMLGAQRALIGDAIAEAALAPLRTRLAALDAAHPDQAVQTLKQVTILFLDVVGSTALSQHLDPEETTP